MQIFKSLIIIICLLCAPYVGSAQEVPYFKGTVYQALEMAQREHKMLVVEFYAPWNYKSRWSHQNVMARKRVYKELEKRFVLVLVDTQTSEGANLASQYEVRDYPTFVLFNQNGNVIDKIETTLDETDFIKRINQVIVENDGKTALQLRRIFVAAKENDLGMANKLATQFIKERDREHIISPLYWDLFSNSIICNYDSYAFRFMLDNRAIFDTVFTKYVVEDKIDDIINTQVMRYAVGTLGYDSVKLAKISQDAEHLSRDRQEVVALLSSLSVYREKKDVDMYIETASRLLRRLEQELMYQIVSSLEFVVRNGTKDQKRNARHLVERYGQSQFSAMQLGLINSLIERLSE